MPKHLPDLVLLSCKLLMSSRKCLGISSEGRDTMPSGASRYLDIAAELRERIQGGEWEPGATLPRMADLDTDRKSTRLNSSHANISYAVFCLKKKKRK